jgi:hypothetical protein
VSLPASVSNAVAAVSAAVAAAGPLARATPAAIAPVLATTITALSVIDAQATVLEASIDQTDVGGVSIGEPAPNSATALLAQSAAIHDLSSLKTARGYLARLRANLVNAPG